MAGWCCFDTTIGPCGIAWGDLGLVGSQLPQATAGATRDRMRRRFPALAEALTEAEMPAEVAAALAGVRAQLRGERHDLSAVRLDLRGISAFHQRVYELTRQLQPGQTSTYGDLAARLGDLALARAVGQALGLNPFAPIVPCHRVLAAGGRSGGFSAVGGARTKLRMLALESAAPNGQPSLF